MKTAGYIISALSVFLLAIAATIGPDAEPFEIYLWAGVIASLVGMFLRWLSYRFVE
jgi:uncharacterized membrane protein YhhN